MGLYKIDKAGKVMSNEGIGKDKKDMEVTNKKIEPKKRFQNINLFAKQVIEKMKKDDVLPSPSNYMNYFEKMLIEKSPAQRAAIEEILHLENDSEIEKEYMSKVDYFLNESFDKTKTLLDDINTNYSKIAKIKNFIKSKGVELSKNPTMANIRGFESKITQATLSIEKEQEKVKQDYLNLTELIKEFNKESIFDKKYGVYNKKYFFEVLKNELENLKNFDYKNNVIAFCIDKDILKSIKLNKDKDIVIKTIAKMILDRSRRSDILAHYEDGIFLLLLKHTAKSEALKAVESIKKFVSFSNFIINSIPIQAKIDTSVIEINSTMSVDEVISDVIKGLL